MFEVGQAPLACPSRLVASPFATAAQIEAELAETARDVEGTLFGLVDAFAALQRLGQPAPQLEPTVEATPTVGETLAAFSGVWTGAGLEIDYRWWRCRGESCEPAGIGRIHVVRRADAGYRLRAVLSAPEAGTAVSPFSAVVPLAPGHRQAADDLRTTARRRAPSRPSRFLGRHRPRLRLPLAPLWRLPLSNGVHRLDAPVAGSRSRPPHEARCHGTKQLRQRDGVQHDHCPRSLTRLRRAATPRAERPPR